MKKLTKYLAMPLISTIIGCCSYTTISPLDKSKLESPTKITEESDVIQYFKKKKFEKAGKSLERIIKKDFSRVFDLDIDLAEIKYGDMGYILIVTEKGSLDTIYSELFFSHRTPKEIEKIEDVAEIYGPKFSCSKISEKKRDLDKMEKLYSAYLMPKGGYALPIIGIKIDPEGHNLYSLVHTIAHEGTHTLIYKESSWEYLYDFACAYLDLTDRDEMIINHETACDLVAERIGKYFKKNHLIRNSRVYEKYEESEKFSKGINRELSEIIREYESLPREKRITQSSEIFRNFEKRIKRKFNLRNFRLNEARLSISKRYSGSEMVNNKLNFLYDELGPKKFIKLIPSLYTSEDLNNVYDKFK